MTARATTRLPRIVTDPYRTWFPLVGDRLNAPDLRGVPTAMSAILVVIAAVEVVRWVLPPEWEQVMIVTLGTRLFELGRFEPTQLYSLFTSWAVHGGVIHALFNGLWLLILGRAAHRHLGNTGLALLFIATSAAGGLTTALVHWGQPVVTIGASGGVFGLIGAAAYFLTGGGTLRRKLARMAAYVAVFMVLNLAFAFVGGAAFGVSGRIGWEAHAGGLLAGLVLYPLLAAAYGSRRRPPVRPI